MCTGFVSLFFYFFSRLIRFYIYVPFGDTWEQGKRHIYTLIFGGGYTDQGEAVLNPIQFGAETTEWGDVDNKDVNVQPQPQP